MIRNMTIDDYDSVNSLWHRIKGFVIRSIDDSREGVERFIKRNPNTCVVAEEDGRIVGSILCGHDGRKGCMYHVCVDPDYRRKGIGKEITKKALDFLNLKKVTGIFMFCAVVLFQIVTLPVEFNASHRALKILNQQNIKFSLI